MISAEQFKLRCAISLTRCVIAIDFVRQVNVAPFEARIKRDSPVSIDLKNEESMTTVLLSFEGTSSRLDSHSAAVSRHLHLAIETLEPAFTFDP